jgi:hypothetical protein
MACESTAFLLAPMCLVKYRNGHLSINNYALKILHKIYQPVVVVAIVGLYHKEKSYLVNRLARENIGECGPIFLTSALSELLPISPVSH